MQLALPSSSTIKFIGNSSFRSSTLVYSSFEAEAKTAFTTTLAQKGNNLLFLTMGGLYFTLSPLRLALSSDPFSFQFWCNVLIALLIFRSSRCILEYLANVLGLLNYSIVDSISFFLFYSYLSSGFYWDYLNVLSLAVSSIRGCFFQGTVKLQIQPAAMYKNSKTISFGIGLMSIKISGIAPLIKVLLKLSPINYHISRSINGEFSLLCLDELLACLPIPSAS